MVVHTCYPSTQRLRHECYEFKASLGYVARSCLKKKYFFLIGVSDFMWQCCFLHELKLEKSHLFLGEWETIWFLLDHTYSPWQEKKKRILLLCQEKQMSGLVHAAYKVHPGATETKPSHIEGKILGLREATDGVCWLFLDNFCPKSLPVYRENTLLCSGQAELMFCEPSKTVVLNL